MPAPEVVQSVTLIIWGGEFDPRDITLGLGLEITWHADKRRAIKRAASGSEPVTRRD